MKLKLLLFSLLLVGCTCSEPEQEQPQYTIGFSQCADDLWRQIMMVQMEAEVAKHPDLRLLTKVAKNNTEEQVSQINDLLDEGVNLLIISPNESVQSITEVAELAYRRGIPTIIWDRKKPLLPA